MNFYRISLNSRKSIPDSIAIRCNCGRNDNDAVCGRTLFLQIIDDITLVI